MDHVKWKRINCVVTADETSEWHFTDTRVCTLSKTWHVVPRPWMLMDQGTVFPAFNLLRLFPNFSAASALFIIYQNVILPFPRSHDSNNAFQVIWDVTQWNIVSSVIKMAMQIIYYALHGIWHQYCTDILARLDNAWKLPLLNLFYGANSPETPKFPLGGIPVVGNPCSTLTTGYVDRLLC